MSLNIPEPLLQLEANCGVFAIWLILKQYQVHIDIADLIKLSGHDQIDGTFTITLAVALKKLGFEVSFYTAPDPNVDEKEKQIFVEAKRLQVPIGAALTYAEIQQAFEEGKFIIVFYDTLEGTGNQSLIYSIDEYEISFCDHFDVMTKAVFERQRQADGICQQVIVIEQPVEHYPI
ncbi:cysteine peptidase family C39 domain-containing protein [Acinetobacter venetianus]|uniref:Lactococcin-G-processing and transport ATP-binding protein LagD n=1 Tax=Acinetobacter venetianus TaxID=52133 RepID=A0A150HVZ7_9GAMM|nr:cysteine peptidase family C39 domain-containing protein [Acinetobacter venetianus]KXZ70834.1 Lactococcin-G-processing and transport ATP-binding protein LagD [Acinetobacter venetianus]